MHGYEFFGSAGLRVRPLPGTAVLALLFVVLLPDCGGDGRAVTTFPTLQFRPFDLEGHRGARGLMPENTLAAFGKALELGVSTLELDVVVSADSHVVVSHEPWFSEDICLLPDGSPIPPGTGNQIRLYDLTYDQIARYDCGSRQHPDFPEQQNAPASKPLLRDVIRLAEDHSLRSGHPPAWYNIETKSDVAGDRILHPPPEEFAGLVFETVAAMGVAGRTIIQSFDVRTLQSLRTRGSEVLLSLLVGREANLGVRQNVDRLGFVPDVYSPDWRIADRESVREAKSLGMRVVPWTVNRPEEMTAMIDNEVDGFITDYPDRALALLRRTK